MAKAAEQLMTVNGTQISLAEFNTRYALLEILQAQGANYLEAKAAAVSGTPEAVAELKDVLSTPVCYSGKEVPFKAGKNALCMRASVAMGNNDADHGTPAIIRAHLEECGLPNLRAAQEFRYFSRCVE